MNSSVYSRGERSSFQQTNRGTEYSRASQFGENEGDTRKMNLDMALQKVGGFGLFQGLAVFSLAVWRHSGGCLIYLFVYLSLA